MDEHDSQLEAHRHWVEKICTTPPSANPLPSRYDPWQGADESPTEHVLRGSRSFAARSFRSRPTYTSSRVPSDRVNDENVDLNTSTYHNIAVPAIHGALNEIASNNQLLRTIPTKLRPSPTPSLKRKKAEAIVRAHGSPTHVRVTAGGRIVPREQSPLCFPRFGYSAIKANGGLIKFAPNQPIGKAAQWAQTPLEGLQNGFVAQDTEGRLCQIVDGAVLPLTESDGALRLYIPAPNLNITQREISTQHPRGAYPPVDLLHESVHEQPVTSRAAVPIPVVPSPSAQLNALELEYTKLELELKDLDKTEVIHGKTMSKPAKEALVAKRRELVIGMDRVRKAIKAVKERPQPKSYSAHSPATRAQSPHSSLSPPTIFIAPQAERAFMGDARHIGQHNEHILANAMSAMHPYVPIAPPYAVAGYPFADNAVMHTPYMLPPPGMMMAPPAFDGTTSWPAPFHSFVNVPLSHGESNADRIDHTRCASQVPQHDGTASKSDLRSPSGRQSHALSFKDPDTKQVVNVRSLLDPKSPEYNPSHDQHIYDEEAAPKTAKDRNLTPLLFDNFAVLRFDNSLSQNVAGDTHKVFDKAFSQRSSESSAQDRSAQDSDRSAESQASEDKENQPPQQAAGHSPYHVIAGEHDRQIKPISPSTSHGPPTVPPGTPATAGDAAVFTHADVATISLDNALANSDHPIGDAHTEQSWHERPIPISNDGNASENGCCETMGQSASQPSLVQSSTIDFSQMSTEWIQGYQAGLHRRAVGAECSSTFLDGYCSGILKSQARGIITASANAIGKHNASDTQGRSDVTMVSRPSGSHLPIESTMNGTDSVKQAIFAPTNKPTSLSPGLYRPKVNDTAHDHGAWQKQHHDIMSAGRDGLCGFPLPERNSSLADAAKQGMQANPKDIYGTQRPTADSDFESSTQLSRRYASHAHPSIQRSTDNGYQNSMAPAPPKHGKTYAGIDGDDSTRMAHALAYRPFSDSYAHGMANPLEWRGSTSYAANITPGFFANAQYDGQPSEKVSHYSESSPMLSGAASIAGAGSHRLDFRFKEVSLDGLSPPVGPRPYSPQVSPKMLPSPASNKLQKGAISPSKTRPTKAISPSKGRFEHLAGKVGLRSSPDKDSLGEDSSSPTKHRWRDIWKGARRDAGQADT